MPNQNVIVTCSYYADQPPPFTVGDWILEIQSSQSGVWSQVDTGAMNNPGYGNSGFSVQGTAYARELSKDYTVSAPSGAASGTYRLRVIGAVTSSGGGSGCGCCSSQTRPEARGTFNLAGVSPSPTITSLTPSSGSPGDVIRVDGSNLSGATQVSLNGASCSYTLYGSYLTFTIPYGATSGYVIVTTPSGTAMSPSTLTVLSQSPSVQGYSPTSGPPGSQVVLTGTNLSAVNSVTLNGLACSIVSVTSTSVTITVPAGATSGTIVVSNPYGSSGSPGPFIVTGASGSVYKPNSPLGLQISNTYPGRTLLWSQGAVDPSHSSATSFNVYDDGGGGAFALLAQGIQDTLYQDLNSYTQGRPRYYVTAVNTAGESDPSVIVLSDPVAQVSTMEKATFLQGVQIGLETSQGVSVPATKKILGATFEHTPNSPVKARMGVGTKAAVGTQRSKVWSDFKMSGPISYNFLPYLAAALIDAGVTPIPVGTTGKAFRFLVAVSPDSPNTPQTMTVEYGSAQGSNSRMSYAHFSDLSLKVNQNTADYEMSGFAQFPVDNIVMTKLYGVSSVLITNAGSGYTSAPTAVFSAPQKAGGVTATGTVVVNNNVVTGVTITNPGSGYTSAPTITLSGGGGTGAAVTPLINTELPAILANPLDFRLNYAPTLAGLSTGKLLKILDIELHINGRWKAAFFVDDAYGGYNSSVELSPNIGGTIVTSMGSDSDMLLQNLMNSLMGYFQLQGTGPLIETGAPNIYHSLKWTMPAYVTKPERGDHEDIYAGTFELTGAHDEFNGDLILDIVTTLPSL